MEQPLKSAPWNRSCARDPLLAGPPRVVRVGARGAAQHVVGADDPRLPVDRPLLDGLPQHHRLDQHPRLRQLREVVSRQRADDVPLVRLRAHEPLPRQPRERLADDPDAGLVALAQLRERELLAWSQASSEDVAADPAPHLVAECLLLARAHRIESGRAERIRRDDSNVGRHRRRPLRSDGQMTSSRDPLKITSISLIHAQPGPPQGARRGGATRVRDERGEGAAVLATVREPPPVPVGSGHRRQARAARRSWDPIDAGRAAAGQPGHRDPGTGRCGGQRAGGTGRPAGGAGPPGRQRVGAEHDRAEGGRRAGAGAPGARAEPARPPSGRRAAGAPTGRGRRRTRLPARRRSGRGGGTSAWSTSSTIRSTS